MSSVVTDKLKGMFSRVLCEEVEDEQPLHSPKDSLTEGKAIRM